MSQLQDIFANEIHQAKKLTLFEPKSTSNSSKESAKDVSNPLEASDLKAEPVDPTDYQNLPELKVEATPSAEPEKNKNLIMGLLKK